MLINVPSLDNYINNHWDEIKEDVIDRMADKLAKSMMVQRPLKKWIFENLSEDEMLNREDEFKNEIIKILEEKKLK